MAKHHEDSRKSGEDTNVTSDYIPDAQYQPLEILDCLYSHEQDILKLISEESEQESKAQNKIMWDSHHDFNVCL